AAAQDARVGFVSVDPDRETPAQLPSYVRYFNERLLGVTGKPQAPASRTQQLAIHCVVNGDGPDYPADHRASVPSTDAERREPAVDGSRGAHGGGVLRLSPRPAGNRCELSPAA